MLGYRNGTYLRLGRSIITRLFRWQRSGDAWLHLDRMWTRYKQ